MDNTRADHCFSTQNDIANDGGAASTGSKHSQTSAVNDRHRKKKLVRTRFVAPQYLMQHLMPCTFRCRMSCAFFFPSKKKNVRQNKKQKRGKAHSHMEGRRLHSVGGLTTNMNFTNLEEYVLLCEAHGTAKANTGKHVV